MSNIVEDFMRLDATDPDAVRAMNERLAQTHLGRSNPLLHVGPTICLDGGEGSRIPVTELRGRAPNSATSSRGAFGERLDGVDEDDPEVIRLRNIEARKSGWRPQAPAGQATEQRLDGVDEDDPEVIRARNIESRQNGWRR